MIRLRHIRRVVEEYESLDLKTTTKRLTGDTSLRAEDAEPSDNVRANVLDPWRSKLRDPMVLPSAGGCHGGHLRHAEGGGAEAEDAYQESPDESAWAAIGKGVGGCGEDSLPCEISACAWKYALKV